MQALGVITSLIGVGMSFFGKNSQAKQQERLAQLNFQAQMQAANQQMEMSRLQFDTNQKLYEQQAAAQRANAAAMRAQADSTDKISRENANRTRADFERMKAIQRARLAKSGVLEAGTPLDMLAETAGQMQLSVANDLFSAGIESEKQRFSAAAEESNAGLTQFAGALQGFKDQASMAQARNMQLTANIDRLVRQQEARNQRQSATGGLFSGLGGIMGGYQKGTFGIF